VNEASQRLKLEWLPGHYAVCRLNPDDEFPAWAASGDFVTITRTKDELSIIVEESCVPGDVRCERGFVAMRIVGVVDFALTGILARLTSALAAAKIPVLAIGTFDTDFLLVRANYAPSVAGALAKVADIPAYTVQ
jgi:uncharacterized protein